MASFWQKIRSDFPLTKKWIYLDHASGGPMPRPVYEKSLGYYKTHYAQADLAWPQWVAKREEVRRAAARFIHADPSEIAFTQSTSQGMNFIAELLAGEGTVLTNTSEFPSSTLPWLWRKARVIFQQEERGRISLEKLKTLLTPSVKTVVTSFVQYATGFRQDLQALGKTKGARYLVVNATQGFGAFPLDVQKCGIDFLCTNSYKWLMGGYGGGILYIRKKWLRKFRPGSVGWRSMNRPEQMNNRKLDLKRDAGRYEWGCPNFPAIFSLGAAVDYLSQIGMQRISERVLALTRHAIRGLGKKGFEVITPAEDGQRAGIVVFKAKKAEELCRALLRKKIYVSLRGAGIRIAPHFYNTFEEIDAFIEQLPAACGPVKR
ncbi:MAG TPA: aminotransferase class V-fold PLP-dependent enzyme [bacterium]|nr:aminotransferase class V-fold PLP-dependent enzyme [bacterium]